MAVPVLLGEEERENMNVVILTGRLTRDPDIRWSQGQDQSCIARFTLAVDRRQKRQEGQQSADFISCVAFGKIAEFFEKYAKKGTKFSIAGRIQTGSYTNREGVKIYTTDVVITSAEFAESKSAAGHQEQPARQQDTQPSEMDPDGFMNIPDGIDEELPFQ